MATINQLLKFSRKNIKISKTTILKYKPQKKAECIKLFTQKPKKPNSANRKVAKVKIEYKPKISLNTDIDNPKIFLNTFIPGEGHNLQKHSTVLIRGGRCQDLPGFKYKLIRGKFDLKGVNNRISSRSKYGVSQF